VKAILTSMVLASASAMAQQAAPEPTLKPGSEVKLEAVTSAKWIQGEPLKAFEPGKVYMFECWATWCGPCIAAIPHVNELHKKYFDKGLRIYGMNVWEDGEDKVDKFVKDKGDGMSYPVAYTGKGSAFENDWLKAAGVRGIPHAFIVKDGKVVLTSHPSQLTDSVIEALLSGDEGAKKAAAEINAAKDAQQNIGKVMQDFRKATAANDTETMAAKLAEFEKIQPDSPYVASMKLDLLVAKKDWPAATKAIEELPEGQARQMPVMMTASKIGSRPDGEYPVEFVKAVCKTFTAMLEDPKMPPNPFGFVTLASLQWKSGDKETALATAKKAAEVAKNPPSAATPAGMKMPVAAFEKYVKAVEEGKLPTTADFSRWMREEMGSGAVPAAKVQPAPAKE
jgi:thiol-disulfide isomerase/thioredoxin